MGRATGATALGAKFLGAQNFSPAMEPSAEAECTSLRSPLPAVAAWLAPFPPPDRWQHSLRMAKWTCLLREGGPESDGEPKAAGPSSPGVNKVGGQATERGGGAGDNSANLEPLFHAISHGDLEKV